ncbi:hypothetical protein ACTOB_001398 [Actinoplanes oblitus]|uniref:Minor tail protein n=1 Tax=Actinoplanes oblitus TaxID=3040509 RepID=A0ABY8WNF6_9ACTN|nr:hypothetical protein [Actinoplanes oblitus]WIM97844.1 hypothetical protein ACTOB_001398 [Actinoplanes oblitus]
MAFPVTPLPLYVGLAAGADPVTPATWTIDDITADVRVGQGVTIQAGRQDEGDVVGATTLNATLDNRGGHYSRVNPLGRWYGKLDKGSPVQARISRIADTFSRTTASGLGTDPVSGITWTGNTAFSCTGTQAQVTIGTDNFTATTIASQVTGYDLEISYTSAVSVLPVGASWVMSAVFWYDATSLSYYKAHTEFQPGGGIVVKVQRVAARNYIDVLGITATGVTYTAGAKIRTRILVVGGAILVKVWPATGSEPAAWSASVTETMPQSSGAGVGLEMWRVAGMTNGSSVVASVDDYRVDVIRATTPVPEWPVRWDQSGKDVTAPITGSGVLHRLSQGQEALRSPMYRMITQFSSLVGHWPLEDGSGATQLANSVSGGRPGSCTASLTLGADGGPGGAASVVQSPIDSTMSGIFRRSSATAGWQISFGAKLATTAPVAETTMFTWTTSNGYLWTWAVRSTTFRLTVTQDDTVLMTNAVTFGTGYFPTNWLDYRFKVSASGGTVTVEAAWFSTDLGAIGTTWTFSGTPGALASWRMATNTATADALWTHIYGVTGLADNLQSSAVQNAFDGYTGELAGNRAARLATEEGIPLVLIGPVGTKMGPQRAATILDLLRECETTNQGVLSERGAGLAYLNRVGLYNQVPVMTLDFNVGHVAAPPEPTDDDLRLRNRIRLSRPSGSEVTVQDDTSISRSGVYADDVEVNLATDPQLTDHAWWRLHLGTVDEPRWPRISLNLARNPSLIGAWCTVRVGSRITVANPPATFAGQSLDLIVEGWTERLGPYSWDVDLVCSPARPWDVAVYDSAASRYDSRTTTLASTAAAGATTLVLTITNPADVWSTKAASQPYDLVISGERVRVPVGGMSTVSGTGPYTQTITGATRAINGIAKSLPAGSEVHIATPGRYAL